LVTPFFDPGSPGSFAAAICADEALNSEVGAHIFIAVPFWSDDGANSGLAR
jgi:hypothetical protein